jgi:hypothetical protein
VLLLLLFFFCNALSELILLAVTLLSSPPLSNNRALGQIAEWISLIDPTVSLPTTAPIAPAMAFSLAQVRLSYLSIRFSFAAID